MRSKNRGSRPCSTTAPLSPYTTSFLLSYSRWISSPARYVDRGVPTPSASRACAIAASSGTSAGIGAITTQLDADVELFKHEDYFDYVQVILILFCAAVAPELAGRDQRDRTISLYFSRAVSRVDYALAKLAALTSVMLVLTLGPQVLLFVGNGMAEDDLDGYLRERWDLVPPIFAGALFISAAIASVGLAVASYVPRRAYATAGIVGVFVVTQIVAAILVDSADISVARYALLVSPFVWEGAIVWFFGVRPDVGGEIWKADFHGAVYAIAGIATTLVAVALTVARFRRIQA